MPLRGVFHAAAVLDDALVKNLDVERYRKTFEPKARGAWNLHEQTRGLALDHFMCFSSMASVLGNQGSANYCAANAFVDALAHHRRRSGLPALTVNWGVIADVGMAADEDFYRQNLERNGLQTMHSSHCLEMLGLLMETDRVQTTVCPIDFDDLAEVQPRGPGRTAERSAGCGGHRAGLTDGGRRAAGPSRTARSPRCRGAGEGRAGHREGHRRAGVPDGDCEDRPAAVVDRTWRRLAHGDRNQDAARSGGPGDVGDPAVEPQLGRDPREDARSRRWGTAPQRRFSAMRPA